MADHRLDPDMQALLAEQAAANYPPIRLEVPLEPRRALTGAIQVTTDALPRPAITWRDLLVLAALGFLSPVMTAEMQGVRAQRLGIGTNSRWATSRSRQWLLLSRHAPS